MSKIFPLILLFISLSFNQARGFQETQNFENYFNQLKTLSGEFTQTNSHGNFATGTIQISRPGKMRLTYNPPSKMLIIADGKWLITKDRESDQVDYVSLDKTPAALILRPHVRFSGDVELVSIIPKEETTEVTLVQKDEPEIGSITLVFQNTPMVLKEWTIKDAQGVETRVSLSKVKSNIPLSDNLFRFESPNLLQQVF